MRLFYLFILIYGLLPFRISAQQDYFSIRKISTNKTFVKKLPLKSAIGLYDGTTIRTKIIYADSGLIITERFDSIKVSDIKKLKLRRRYTNPAIATSIVGWFASASYFNNPRFSDFTPIEHWAGATSIALTATAIVYASTKETYKTPDFQIDSAKTPQIIKEYPATTLNRLILVDRNNEASYRSYILPQKVALFREGKKLGTYTITKANADYLYTDFRHRIRVSDVDRIYFKKYAHITLIGSGLGAITSVGSLIFAHHTEGEAAIVPAIFSLLSIGASAACATTALVLDKADYKDLNRYRVVNYNTNVYEQIRNPQPLIAPNAEIHIPSSTLKENKIVFTRSKNSRQFTYQLPVTANIYDKQDHVLKGYITNLTDSGILFSTPKTSNALSFFPYSDIEKITIKKRKQTYIPLYVIEGISGFLTLASTISMFGRNNPDPALAGMLRTGILAASGIIAYHIHRKHYKTGKYRISNE